MIEAVADDSGCPRVLVADPEGLRARRFAGCFRDPARDGEPEFLRKFSCRKEVKRVLPELKRAVADGDLMQHGPVVLAANASDAEMAISAVLEAAE